MPQKKRISLNIVLFLFFIDLLETFVQFCFKKSVASLQAVEVHSIIDGMRFVKDVLPSPFLWLGLCSVLCIFVSWSTILSKIDLSVAVPICSLSYIGVPVISMIFFHEQISILRWSGIGLILTGVVLVSMNSSRSR